MGERWKQADFTFLGSQITADSDCCHEVRRRLLLGRKAMTSLDSILKSRDITLPTKGCLVKAMVFPIVMYGCESWTIRKAERQRTDAFELCCWRRLLRVSWTARRSHQSILKEINPQYSLERLILKLKMDTEAKAPKLWPPKQRADSLEKALMREEKRATEWEGWRASSTHLDMCAVLSHFSRVQLCAALCGFWAGACQAPLSMGFFRQEYWSGLIHSPPEDLPDLEIKPKSLTSPALAGGFFTTSTTWEAPVHEFEQTLGDAEGQRSLACWSPWGHEESDMT